MADLAVIVPTVLGLGLLFTLATLLRDAYHRARGPGWMSRRCGVDGRASALWAASWRRKQRRPQRRRQLQRARHRARPVVPTRR